MHSLLVTKNLEGPRSDTEGSSPYAVASLDQGYTCQCTIIAYVYELELNWL